MAASDLSRRYSPFRLNHVQVWFVPALLITLAVHAAGYYLLHVTRYSGFTPPRMPTPSRVFQMKQAQIDPKALEDKKPLPESEKVSTKPVPDVTAIQIPGETKPNYEKFMQEANTDLIAAPEAARTIAQQKPKVDDNKQLRPYPRRGKPFATARRSPVTHQLSAHRQTQGFRHASFLRGHGRYDHQPGERRTQRGRPQLQRSGQPPL